jgi:hypothetical protein
MQAHLTTIHQDVLEWMGDWGPIPSWPVKITDDLEQARETDTLEAWLTNASTRLNCGRALLCRLWALPSFPLPKDVDEVRNIWRQSFELVGTVQNGVSCLESRLEMVQEW